MLPQGYQVHPQSPAHAWNPQTGHCCLITELGPPQHTDPASGSVQWGEQDMDATAAAAAQDGSGGGGQLWLDFPELGPSGAVSFLFRIFPPWRRGLGVAYKKTASHRIYARLLPDPPDKEYYYVPCPAAEGRTCALCDTLSEISAGPGAALAKEGKARIKYLYQGINLSNPSAHFRNGRWEPGLLRVGKKLNSAIIDSIPKPGPGEAPLNNTSLQHGFAIELIKRRGNEPKRGNMNVEYAATHHAHARGPMAPELMSAYDNGYDLDNVVRFLDDDVMNGICENIRRTYGQSRALGGGMQIPSYPQAPQAYAPPAAPLGLPHGFQAHPTPGFMWNPSTGAVVPIPAPAAPPPPPTYAPPPAPPTTQAYAQPPAPPPAPPQAYAQHAPALPQGYPQAPQAYAPPPAPALPQGYPGAPQQGGYQAPPAPPPAPPAAPRAAAPYPQAALPPPTAPGLAPGGYPPVPPLPSPGQAPQQAPRQLEASFGQHVPPPPPPAPYPMPGVPQPPSADDIPF